MTTQERIFLNAVDFAARVVESAIPTKEITDREKMINIQFAKNSTLLELFCLCSDTFEYERLKKIIIERNVIN